VQKSHVLAALLQKRPSSVADVQKSHILGASLAKNAYFGC